MSVSPGNNGVVSGGAVTVAPGSNGAVSSGVAATAVLTFTAAVSTTGEVTLNGVVITRFDASPTGPYPAHTTTVSEGAPLSAESAALAVSGWVNSSDSSGGLVTAVAVGAVVTITAVSGGTAANAYALTSTVAGATWSEATMTGGTGALTVGPSALGSGALSLVTVAPSFFSYPRNPVLVGGEPMLVGGDPVYLGPFSVGPRAYNPATPLPVVKPTEYYQF